MENADYLRTQNEILAISGALYKVRIDDFLDAITRAKTLGPILDPTLYRQASENLDLIEKLALKLKEVKMIREHLQDVIVTEIFETALKRMDDA